MTQLRPASAMQDRVGWRVQVKMSEQVRQGRKEEGEIVDYISTQLVLNLSTSEDEKWSLPQWRLDTKHKDGRDAAKHFIRFANDLANL